MNEGKSVDAVAAGLGAFLFAGRLSTLLVEKGILSVDELVTLAQTTVSEAAPDDPNQKAAIRDAFQAMFTKIPF